MPRSKSPATKKSVPAGGAIAWGDFEANSLTTPLVVFAVLHIVYAIEMLGFQITDNNMQPSFKVVPACQKYLAKPDGCAENNSLTILYRGFGTNLLSNALTVLIAAFRSDNTVAATLAKNRMLQTMIVATLLIGGRGVLAEDQIKLGIFLQLGLAFYLQDALRGNAQASHGKRDFHKHGNAGYFNLGMVACQLFYFVNYGALNAWPSEAGADTDTSSPAVVHLMAWTMMSVGILASDGLFAHEYNTTAEIVENFKYQAAIMGLSYYLTTLPEFVSCFNAAAHQQITTLQLVFAAGSAAVGFGFV